MKRILFMTMLGSAASGWGIPDSGTSAPLKSSWNVVGRIPMDEIIVQSHRGAGELAAENTTAAFELGWKLQTIPEADLRATTDGVIVAFHDADFKRVVKDCPPELLKKGVQDISWRELQQLEVGQWKGGEFIAHRVPKLADVFTLMQGRADRRLYMDIKNVELPALASLVIRYHVEKQIILATPKHEIIKEWKALVPQSDTLLWIPGTEPEVAQRLAALRSEQFQGITQVQIHVHLKRPAAEIHRGSVDPFKLSDAFLIKAGEELRSGNILFQTFPYAGTTAEVYGKLLDLGLMSFATDSPDVTREAIARYYTSAPGSKR